MTSYECRWGLTIDYRVHYTDMVTLIMALNLPLNTLGLIITYNVLNLESFSYAGLTTCIDYQERR